MILYWYWQIITGLVRGGNEFYQYYDTIVTGSKVWRWAHFAPKRVTGNWYHMKQKTCETAKVIYCKKVMVYRQLISYNSNRSTTLLWNTIWYLNWLYRKERASNGAQNVETAKKDIYIYKQKYIIALGLNVLIIVIFYKNAILSSWNRFREISFTLQILPICLPRTLSPRPNSFYIYRTALLAPLELH